MGRPGFKGIIRQSGSDDKKPSALARCLGLAFRLITIGDLAALSKGSTFDTTKLPRPPSGWKPKTKTKNYISRLLTCRNAEHSITP